MRHDFSTIFDALGWAVLHSAWQGAALLALVVVARRLISPAAPDLRFLASFFALLAMFFGFIMTFVIYLGRVEVLTGPAADGGGVIAAAAPLATAVSEGSGSALNYLTGVTDMIGALWTLCFLLASLRYLTAFRQTHKLQSGAQPPAPQWQTRFAQLRTLAGVGKRAALLVTDSVAGPVTYRFIRPVVLVPTWFFTGLSPAQCEAILLHELAHIRRHDYLINILITAVKAVFFYHPVAIYLARLASEDREQACDDFAIARQSRREDLALALGKIRMRSAKSDGVFALAAEDGRDTPLMARLKRLAGQPELRGRVQLGRGHSAIIAMTVIAIGVMASRPDALNAEAAPANPQIELAGASKAKDDSKHHQKKEEIYNYDVLNRSGKFYTIKTGASGKSYIKISGNWYATEDKAKLIAGAPMPPRPVGAVPTPRPNPTPTPEPMPITHAEKKRIEKSVRADVERAERELKLNQRAKEKRAESLQRDAEKMQREVEKMQRVAQKLERQAENLEREAEKLERQAERTRREAERRAERNRVHHDARSAKFRKMENTLIPLLKRDGYWGDNKKVSLKMHDNDVYVNGQKVSASTENDYCKAISIGFKRKSDMESILMKPGYMHIHGKGENGHITYKFNDY